MDGLIKGNEADIAAYDISSKVALGDAQLQLERYRAENQRSMTDKEFELTQAQINLDSVNRQHALQVEAHKSSAAVSAQIVASSLTSNNATASIGYDGGYNASYSYDRTKETDSGATTSHIHTYSEV